MAGSVFFNNGIAVSAWGSDLLNALLTDVVGELEIQESYANQKKDLCFVDVRALSLDQTFSSIAWPTEIDEINENGVKPEGERVKNPNKGFEIIEYGQKLTTSFIMTQWIKKSKSIRGASDSVKQAWQALSRDSKFLIKGAMIRMTIEMTKVYTEWFGAISQAKGAGSPTPKGLPLFSLFHTSKQGAITWRNMGNVEGTVNYLNAPLTLATWHATLQNALNVMKNVVKLENGYKPDRPADGVWDLVVSSLVAPIARRLLNETQSGTPLMYSGRSSWPGAGNEKETNQFMFQGNKIRLIEIPLLWDTDKHNNMIGTPQMWFLRNSTLCKEIKALKCINLYDPIMKNYQNDDTDAYVVDIRAGFAVDHYGAELVLFGSKWDWDTGYNF